MVSASCATKKKHKTGYNPLWKREFPWIKLVYGDEGTSSGIVTGIMCSLCQRHSTKQRNGVGTWTEKPCTLLRKDTLQQHKASSMHKEAEELESYRVASQRDGGIVSAFSSTVSSQRKALVGAMKLLYWLAKEEIPITTKFSSLLDLSIQMGNDYLKELHLGGNAHYTNEQSISELLQCLSTSIEEDIVSSLKSSPYFALMTDETTDISVLKQLVLVCRNSTSSGIKTSYFQITDIPNGNTIETSLLQALREKEIDISKLRGFGSDGAAVMVGSRNGVAKKLKGHSPRIVSVHCINHRLALAAAHATDCIPYL